MTSTPPATVDVAGMTRAQRATLPLTTEVAQAIAEQHGVCAAIGDAPHRHHNRQG